MIWLLACVTADDTGEDPCVDEPHADWDTFGSAFIQHNCQACHGSEGDERHDAPAGVSFDDADDVWARKELVLAYAGSEPPSMPPLGGTTATDRALLRAWLTCGVEGE